jgi:hypothetical protein
VPLWLNFKEIHLPGADFVDRSFGLSNRSPQVMRSLQALYGNGRLANTGYMSILPVDQGIEHSGGASFAPNPIYFDGENIVNWPWRAAATRWPPPTACWAAWRASTPTRSPSS